MNASMNASLKDQLSVIKLDFSVYGNLPSRDQVLILRSYQLPKDEIILQKQWEKLYYLRKHLITINKYLLSQTDEILKNWLQKNRLGISHSVLKKIGNSNNETGGISIYYINLQNFYDEEEVKYDELEKAVKPDSILKEQIELLQKNREEKRKTRKKIRSLQLKDLKKNNKGYLLIAIEEPPLNEKKPNEVKPNELKDEKELKTDGIEEQEQKTETTEDLTQQKEQTKEQITEIIKKQTDMRGVWFAGSLIAVSVVSIIYGLNKK